MIVADNQISREVLAEKAGISVVAVQNHINKLKSIGLIKRVGSTRKGRWETMEKELDNSISIRGIGINDGINDGKDVGINDVKELTERQRVILEMIVLDPFLSAKDISEKSSEKISEKSSEKSSEKTSEKASEKGSISARTIEKDLAQLKKKGFLKRVGGRKNGQWVVANSFVSENDCQKDSQNAFVSENDSQSDSQK